MTEHNEERRTGRAGYLVRMILCILVPLGCIAYLVYYQVTLRQQQARYQEMQDSLVVTTQMREGGPKADSGQDGTLDSQDGNGSGSGKEPGKSVDLSSYGIPEKDLDFAALKETNADIYAWLTIPDTVIDYPVLQHPTELDYYLEYNMDGSKGRPGCLYTELLNDKDFGDFNTVIYGHNMRNGTMFHDLHYYEDTVFFEEHPYLYLYTEAGPLVYEVFAAYEFSNVHLLMGFDLTSEEMRGMYLENIYNSEGMTSNFRGEVPVTADSRILTLSTCVDNKPEKRYLVAAVLVADGRSQSE